MAAIAVLPGGGHKQISDATWASSDGKVATVSNTGLLTLIGLGDADVTATFQNLRGAAHVVPHSFAMGQPITGFWSGFLRVTEAPAYPRYVGTILPFDLRLNATPDGYAGSVQIGDGNSIGLATVDVDIAGTTGTNGFAVLSGSRADIYSSTKEVWGLSAKTNSASGLEGSIRFGTRTPEGDAQFLAEILSASWRADSSSPPLRPGPFDGIWRATSVRTACAGDCSFHTSYLAYTLPDGAFNLTMSQVDRSLLALIAGTEVNGTASDTTFELSRSYAAAACPDRAPYDFTIVCTETIAFSGSIDSGGVLRGGLERHQEGVDYRAGRYSWTASFEVTARR